MLCSVYAAVTMPFHCVSTSTLIVNRYDMLTLNDPYHSYVMHNTMMPAPTSRPPGGSMRPMSMYVPLHGSGRQGYFVASEAYCVIPEYKA